MLRMVLRKLKADPAAIAWDELGSRHHNGTFSRFSRNGTISIAGVTFKVSAVEVHDVSLVNGPETRISSSISLGELPKPGIYRKRDIPLRSSNPLLNWQIHRAVRASYLDFGKQLKRREQDATQKAIGDALGKMTGMEKGQALA